MSQTVLTTRREDAASNALEYTQLRHHPPTSDVRESETAPSILPGTPESLKSDADPVISPPPNIPFRPISFARPTAIPINRERLRKPDGGSESSPSGKSLSVGLIKKAANSLYRYRKIKDHEIRLLLIKPGSQKDPLNATLLTVDDSYLGTEDCSFAALSYNWGDSPTDNTIIIQDDLRSTPITSLQGLIDGAMQDKGLGAKRLLIKPNLHEALIHLRQNDQVLSIWVDALCINQNDEVEKQVQVMKMAHIYRSAYNVCIWLGSDKTDERVSDVAMKFIPKAIEPNSYYSLLNDPDYLPQWASLFDLLRWSWFSRRWVIQELALARDATVHCGAHTIHWADFQDAIAIFCRDFNTLKPKLREFFERSGDKRRNVNLTSAFEIDQLGAKVLVEITSSLFRKRPDGTYESTMSLENLVCRLSNFDTSDPRDTINAFLNICKERNNGNFNHGHPVPEPDYSKDLFSVYRDFVKWVITTSNSLDIICRYWALPERQFKTPTTPRLVELPTWIQSVDDSAFGRGEEVFDGRKAGDSFVGLPGFYQYHASGTGWRHKSPKFRFPIDPGTDRSTSEQNSKTSSSDHFIDHDMSLLVTGVAIGEVSFRNQPFADGVIPKECLEKLGWSFNWRATSINSVPDQLWQTLVADRGLNGAPKPHFYRRACQHCLVNLTRNGHINIDTLLRESNGYTKDYLERVRAVTWDRSFIEGSPIVTDKRRSYTGASDALVGLGPPKTKEGDVIAILYGCSVPVILRPIDGELAPQSYEFVGEAYIYGKMDGEAIDEHYEEREFRLI